LPINKIIYLAYLWLCQVSSSSIISLTGCSKQVVANWTANLRQVVEFDLQRQSINPESKIGGPGIVVEIDESKFGKRKYNRGHRVEGSWVVGAVELTEQRRLFLETVQDRSAPTLTALIQRHVAVGSIIHSDTWKGYSTLELERLGYSHGWVNHSVEFVHQATGIHINTIEGTWSGVKSTVNKRNRVASLLDGYLMTFIWRRKYRGMLWSRLLIAIATVKYENI
jgi:hypothetical protein